MTQQTLLVFVLVAAVFLACASVGQILLRIRLARLERINMRLDQRRLNTFAKAWRLRSESTPDFVFESEVRDEIETILTEIEKS